MPVKVLMEHLVQRDNVELRVCLGTLVTQAHWDGLETQVMSAVKVRKAAQVLVVSLDLKEQKEHVVQMDLVDRLEPLDLLDLLERLVSLPAVVRIQEFSTAVVLRIISYKRLF